MSRVQYIVVNGSEIVRHGFAKEASVDAMRAALETGEELIVREPDAPRVEDTTHQWDAATQQVVEK
jgi:hypothetical protein